MPDNTGGKERKTTKDPKASKEHDPEQGLTNFLTDSHCTDLILLTTTITERMRQCIIANFDPSAGLNRSLLGDRNRSEDEKILNPDIDLATVDVGVYDAEKKLLAEREKQISAPDVQQLKTDALKDFDGWRDMVIKRVSEAVHLENEAQMHITMSAKTGEAFHQPMQTSLNAAPKLEDVFPRVKTSLTKLPIAKRVLILHSVILLLISLKNYSPRSRVFLLYLVSSLKLGLKPLRGEEENVAKGLLESAQQINADDEAQEKVEASDKSRKWKMAAATAAGAAVIGITGGMAAPMIASGVGAVMGGLGLGATVAAGYLGSVAGSTYLVGALFGAYGGKMTGQMMDNLSREVEDFAFLPVHGRRKEFTNDNEAAAEERRLRVTIGITGWLTEKEEIVKPWRVLNTNSEAFALRWELETLMTLGNSINTLLGSAAWGYAQSQIIQKTIFAELMSSMMWPMGLVKVARVIDNPFTLAKSRADKAGVVIANALINRAQGERSVTLIGYSMGARVIYACLQTLAKKKAFDLVENAILIGSPTPSDIPSWRLLRSACTGRLVNVYSEKDHVLAFLYRTSSIQYGVAGLSKIEGLSGVENVDVSETVNGHLRYRFLIGKILVKIGLQDLDKDEVKREEAAFEKMLAEEKEQDYIRQAKEKSQAYLGRKDVSDKEAEDEAANMEKEIAQKNKKSMMQWASEQLYISRAAPTNLEEVSKTAAKVSDLGSEAADNTVVPGPRNKKTYYQYAKDSIYLHRSGSKNEDLAKEGISEIGPSYLIQATRWASEHLPSWHSTTRQALGASKDVTGPVPDVGARDTGSEKSRSITGKSTGYISSAASYLPSLPTWSSTKDSMKTPKPEENNIDASDASTLTKKTALYTAGDTSKETADTSSTVNERVGATTAAVKDTIG